MSHRPTPAAHLTTTPPSLHPSHTHNPHPQSSAGLPESGVCDERTWLSLLGPNATPSMVDELKADEAEYEDDMGDGHDGAVWLLGEQRWSRPGI
jgi:hypothetical protein